MSLFKCPVCLRRPGTKAITIFWAWRDSENQRHAFRQQLCPDCVTTQLMDMFNGVNEQDLLTCPRCGIVTEDDYDAVYANAFIPGYGRMDVESPLCTSCAGVLRSWIRDHAIMLEDRGRADASPSSHPSGVDVLRSMGIVPRAL